MEHQIPPNISFELSRNEHAVYYETVDQACASGDFATYRHSAWKNKDAMDRALVTCEVWRLVWYPLTPVCFFDAVAPSLPELLAWANELAQGSTDAAL